MSGNGEYNRNQDARMDRERRQREHQEFLASLTPEQLRNYNEERQRALDLGRRQARIWSGTVLHRRHIDNVISEEDDFAARREAERQQQQPGGGRKKKRNTKRNTRRTRKHKKTRRHRTKKYNNS
jgi:hypothetical protein